MRKIINFIKNYWILIMIVLAGLLYIVNLFIKGSSPTSTPTPTPVAQRASYKDIFPGISSEADLRNALGTPLKTTTNESGIIDEYKSTSELRRHIATIKSGKVVFFKEIVSANDKTTATDITNIYGVAPNILYNKSPNSTFNLYVYPSNGIAYIGHSDGALLEIWYFEPTTIDNFINLWGQDYSTSPSTETVQ